MFKPKYQITDKLLDHIKKINRLVIELNQKRFPDVVLAKLEKSAREISSYASTSIEGNPLPLTEVKKVLKSKPKFIRDSEKEVINYNKALVKLNPKNLRMDFVLLLITSQPSFKLSGTNKNATGYLISIAKPAKNPAKTELINPRFNIR